jgi:hypothetical protein
VLLDGAERLEQAQGDVAVDRILAQEQRHLVTERRDPERPVDEQEHAGAVPGVHEVALYQPGHQRDADQRVHRLEQRRGSLQGAAGARPVDQHALVLEAHGRLGAVGAHRDQAQQRVEVEARQRASLHPHPQLTLQQHGLGDDGHQHHGHAGEHDQERVIRAEPDQARRGHRDLQADTDHLSAQAQEQVEHVQAVTALGHVRDRTAVEVAVVEQWDLAQKRHAQPGVQVPAQAQQARGHGEIERPHAEEEERQDREPAQALPLDLERVAQLEQAAEQQRFHAAARGHQGQAEEQTERRQRTILAKQPQELTPGPDPGLGQRGRELGRALGPRARELVDVSQVGPGRVGRGVFRPRGRRRRRGLC